MGRFRSLVAQSPAIVIAVVAAALSLGGGAYASTQLATGHHSQQAAQARAGSAHAGQAVTTTGVSWSPITLLNGWASENSTYQSGNPKVAVQSGVVYLSGSLAQATPGSAEFALLPKQFRPTHNMWITVYTFGDTSGTLFIGANGIMEAFSPGTCGSGDTAQCYTSLASVSYPVNS